MKKCAFLSMDSLEDYECYDHLLFEPFQKYGWSAEEISWRNRQANWDQYEAVIIRSPWDYQQDPKAFFEVLKEIEASSALLENKLELVEWNIDKTYLRDLEEQGITIVPSLWEERFDNGTYMDSFKRLSSDEIIVKPTISAGAEDTFRIPKDRADEYTGQLQSTFADRPYIVQPFMPDIIKEGEFSLFYFGDTYSHTVLKTPKKDDFRVQEEHGGVLKLVEAEPEMRQISRKILDLITPQPLYARIDLVRHENGFALMELELIEPSLYFNMDPQSPERFAKVFDEWMRNQ
ncbi:hypothetical protein LQ318_01490 [Aliifodinibius salicampi]|uniref:Prokaryotic glutathione synthetase ATP-binding domain-containing protein n=1 Tax=Fodinibius salicampi TaxID=1920655 RepID=A0ABT3PUN5_9BACT|nr:hypothetical protein [Fodinibius salicampi]MCW9711564.1 hypothetical protein [Fodinibius salicampi]